MTITWAGARTKVRGDLWRTGSAGIPDDVCDRALHASILEIEGERRFRWLQDLTTPLTALVEADNIPAPADTSSVGTLAYLNGTSSYDVLDAVSLARIREEARGAGVGRPSLYCFHDGKFYFDTRVAIGSQFELIYASRTSRDLVVAVAAGDTNATLQREQATVIKGACAEVALSYLKNEVEAARQRRSFESKLELLSNEEDEARTDDYGGGIQPDTCYRDAAFGRNS
ncbi:MAG TPA: hypothetical protein VGR19_02235 [Allosphingosinicella sp.]|nr:hypothetical protein [Allosphingosinicella sp.]